MKVLIVTAPLGMKSTQETYVMASHAILTSFYTTIIDYNYFFVVYLCFSLTNLKNLFGRVIYTTTHTHTHIYRSNILFAHC